MFVGFPGTILESCFLKPLRYSSPAKPKRVNSTRLAHKEEEIRISKGPSNPYHLLHKRWQDLFDAPFDLLVKVGGYKPHHRHCASCIDVALNFFYHLGRLAVGHP